MFAPLFVEIAKLRRSLALVLALVAPSLVAVFLFFNVLRGDAPMPWSVWLGSALGIWAFFMLPMSVTALTALTAHMEHGPKSWDHLRALPVPRWRIYAAKVVCVLGLVGAMSVAVPLLAVAALELASRIKPAIAPSGSLDLARHLMIVLRMEAAALLLIAIQLWLSLRFSSFVPGLAVGIGGTFFAVVATAAKQGVFWPWQMPVNMLAEQAWRVDTALALGAGGGLVLLLLMLAHLSLREVR